MVFGFVQAVNKFEMNKFCFVKSSTIKFLVLYIYSINMKELLEIYLNDKRKTQLSFPISYEITFDTMDLYIFY